jgi:hypothetical protein
MDDMICITGMGIVSAYGVGTDAFVRAYEAGNDGVRTLTLFDSQSYRRRVAAEVQGFDAAAMFGKRQFRTHDRVSLLLLAATDLLYANLGLAEVETRRAHFKDDQVGIVIGTAGSLRSVSEFDLQSVRAPEYVTPSLFPNTVFCAAASYVAIRRSIRGSCITLSNGEPSSLQSVALGVDRLLQGNVRQVVVGGAEELTEISALAIQARHDALCMEAPILGEGAVVFTLEARETARRRGAPELACLLASAASCCLDVQQAYEQNLSRIREQVGAGVLGAVRNLFSAQKVRLRELKPLGGSDIKVHALYPRFGYVGALTGGLAIAAMLADQRILPGELVLVNNASDEGNTSTVLLRKTHHAWSMARC